MRTTHLYHTITKLLAITILCMSFSHIQASARLTVVVMVDGMTQANMTMLRPYWSQGGLRTLSEEALQSEISYPHWIYGGSETVATMMTGTTPNHHGYSMDTYFARSDRKAHQLIEDDRYKGIGTHQHLSARALLAPTITDELRMQNPKSMIYAIGITPATTLLMAGHGANACCWMDADNLRWVTTTYYDEGLPSVADEMNVKGRFQEIASRVWTPRLSIPMYTHPTDHEKKKSFSYDCTRILTHSPAANTLVIELALAIQKKQHLGEDANPDMLLLQLTTQSPNTNSDQIQSAEQEDMYLSINQDLGFLMEQLNKRLGKTNYEILLIGLPRLGTANETIQQTNMTINEFNVDRAAALTATYLMAIYGHERWIDGGYGNSIYLNRTLIEQKRMSLETIQRQVANFMMEFEGVEIAYPAYEAVLLDELRPSLNKHTMGDVVFTLEPNWRLMTNEKTTHDYVIDQQPTSPVMLWSTNYRQWTGDPILATEIKSLILK